MKDRLGPAALVGLAEALRRAEPRFAGEAFIQAATAGLAPLELKARVGHIASVLARFLPADFPEASKLLVRLVPAFDGGDQNSPLRGFAAWPLLDYVGTHGLTHFALGLETLRQLTRLFTAEFAIRSYFERDAEQTLAAVKTWVNDPDPDVRRLCSEGMRPLLPWGKRVAFLGNNPERIIAILDALAFDESEFVRRSVANTLNDFSKTHPDLTLATCSRWLAASPAASKKQTAQLVRRATRTLIKGGNALALGLMGVGPPHEIDAPRFQAQPKTVALGEHVELLAVLTSRASVQQKVVVDYVVHHRKANGKSAPKVFKWKVLHLEPAERLTLTKRHAIRLISTRKYYPGQHVLELLVNGAVLARAEFRLVATGGRSQRPPAE